MTTKKFNRKTVGNWDHTGSVTPCHSGDRALPKFYTKEGVQNHTNKNYSPGVEKSNKYNHKLVEKKWPRTDLTSNRNLSASRNSQTFQSSLTRRSRGAIIRGKQESYDHRRVEKHWQNIWKEMDLYSPGLSDSKKKFYGASSKNASYNLHKPKTTPKNTEEFCKKFYNLWMFPYPSAEGLHAGHAFASTGSDVYGRFMRMKGYNVFQPIGYDSFGIHSENFAIKINDHPKKMITRTTKHYEEQMRSLGHAYDWTRTVTTSDPDYYRWTQWLFVQMFKAGLAYKKKAKVNWCSSCKTVLADEQVVTPAAAGKDPKNAQGEVVTVSEGMQVCERCGTLVERKDLEQWFFKITDYADKLLSGLDEIKWPEKIKTAQRNWIGRSEGALISFSICHLAFSIEVFTTRPDTLYGATFLVVSPTYAKDYLLKYISADKKKSVTEYINTTPADHNGSVIPSENINKNHSPGVNVSDTKQSQQYSNRTIEPSNNGTNSKTGVDSGLSAINPATNKEIPIYISDYVLDEYGTGAIMGVPAHDERDFEFANKFNLPIVSVIVPDIDFPKHSKILSEPEALQSRWPNSSNFPSLPYVGEGKIVNSGDWDGLKYPQDFSTILSDIEKKGWGKRKSQYHLRDWLISRQRYWGPPIPIIYCQSCAKEGISYFTEKLKNENTSTYSKATVDKEKQNIGNWKLEIGNSIDVQSMEGWYPVPESDLPVLLPDISDFKPQGSGKGPLANHPEFYKTKCPGCGGEAERETDVSDTFLDSAWYFLRYPSVRVEEQESGRVEDSNKSKIENKKIENETENGKWQMENFPWDSEITRNWLPVDLYFGGAEHAVLHLMYARFVWKMLVDNGFIEKDLGYEPFPWFFAHGLMIKDGAKMSKSRGNVVNPDRYIEKYGADTLRLYLMFMGPMDGYPDFRDTGIEGMRKFVDRVWQLFEVIENGSIDKSKIDGKCPAKQGHAQQEKIENGKLLIKMHQTIKKVTEDIQEFKYNTAISAIMEYVNSLREFTLKNADPNADRRGSVNTSNNSSPVGWNTSVIPVIPFVNPAQAGIHRNKSSTGGSVSGGDSSPRVDCNLITDHLITLSLLLAPFTPHLAEELYQRYFAGIPNSKFQMINRKMENIMLNGKLENGKFMSVHRHKWPSHDPKLVIEEKITIPIQVNGKLRATIEIETDKAGDKEYVLNVSKGNVKIQKWLVDRKVEKEIYIPGRLVNIVVN